MTEIFKANMGTVELLSESSNIIATVNIVEQDTEKKKIPVYSFK